MNVIIYILKNKIVSGFNVLNFLIFIFTPFFAHAEITGAHGMEYDPGEVLCSGSTSSGADGAVIFKANRCTLTPIENQYVPHSGYYKVEINGALFNTFNTWMLAQSSAAYFDDNIPIDQQHIAVSGTDYNPGPVPDQQPIGVCYRLVDESGNKYYLEVVGSTSCTGEKPLPPTPPHPPTSCSINNGNMLNVNFGTLDRALLVTVPGTGSPRHIPISVECTGGVNVPVNMTLSYTPFSASGIEVVKSSANGLGISIIYNGKPLSTSDVTPIALSSGSNDLDLAFEAVRDPAVEVGDVKTGAFTASATLVMTQQ